MTSVLFPFVTRTGDFTLRTTHYSTLERISVIQARSWENVSPAFGLQTCWVFHIGQMTAAFPSLLLRSIARRPSAGWRERGKKITFEKKNLWHCGISLSCLIPVLMTVCESIKETGQIWVAEQRMRPHNSALRCKAFTTATLTVLLFTNVLINVNQVAKHLFFKLHIFCSLFSCLTFHKTAPQSKNCSGEMLFLMFQLWHKLNQNFWSKWCNKLCSEGRCEGRSFPSG